MNSFLGKKPATWLGTVGLGCRGWVVGSKFGELFGVIFNIETHRLDSERLEKYR